MGEAHASALTHLGLEAVLGFELRKEGFGIERFSQDLHLTLHGCKVTQAQLVELRQPFAPSDLDEVILGCAAPSVDEVNIGRVAALRMGCGQKVPGWTVMRNCASGMQALDSTTVSGFPNLFIMNGPNTGLGHNSVLYVVESQIDYIVGGLAYMKERSATVLEARPESETEYVDEMIDRAAGTVWLTGGCKNWYVDYRTNRLTVTWPDFAYAFRDSNGEFVPEHYATA